MQVTPITAGSPPAVRWGIAQLLFQRGQMAVLLVRVAHRGSLLTLQIPRAGAGGVGIVDG